MTQHHTPERRPSTGLPLPLWAAPANRDAAWLHDIGYAPDLALTACTHSMVPVTCATPSTPTQCCAGRSPITPTPSSKPTKRGLADVLSLETEPAPHALSSVLTCCDMTTSPDGELVPVEKRLAEIHDRYGLGHLVSRSIRHATPMIRRAVERVHDRAARTA